MCPLLKQSQSTDGGMLRHALCCQVGGEARIQAGPVGPPGAKRGRVVTAGVFLMPLPGGL